ncbi:unnamed protein product [Linum tenue]|uniref:Ubiquitin-like domain-containing protein n=1 Tax=Linum tenue TaxID=586396 RepID=A0AAV0NFF4_9ROSI|nr:unnamed protein product [Linum tenue]
MGKISMKMLKMKSKKFCKGISFKLIGGSKRNNSIDDQKSPSSSSLSSSSSTSSSFSSSSSSSSSSYIGEIKWEVRPGGMLVQKRQNGDDHSTIGELITLRVSTVSQWHDISIEATSTFGELKMVLAMVTNLEPKEQRVLFKGKEREDCEFLHMVGVRDKDKVLLLEDPAIKEMKLMRRLHGLSSSSSSPLPSCTRTISV